MVLQNKQKELLKYYQTKKNIDSTIKQEARTQHATLFGGQAINLYAPEYLRQQTRDYDFFTKNPEKTAMLTEKKLESKFHGNYFETVPAKHTGTWKVMSIVEKKTVVDYSKSPNKVPYVRKAGVQVATLGFLEGMAKKAIKNPEAKFRRDKDIEQLQRLRLIQLLNKKGSKKW